jgi:hypothetical protein
MNGRAAAVKHSAPGQYLGFALQPVRLCYHLLTCPDGADVSLEHLDDIAVHYPNGSVLVEQAKSALTYNALSDWSEDLWKTIANWLEAVRSGALDAKRTTFRLYVTPPKIGKWSDALSTATTSDQVAALTGDIREKLARRGKPPACLSYLKVFLDATETERYELVSRITIQSENEDPVDALRTLLKVTIPSDVIDGICHAAIGMAKERADRQIRRREAALVQANAFRKEFYAFVQKNNIPGYLGSFSMPPEPNALQQMLSKRPVFVKQLQFIEITPEQQLRAISDYLRTSADKVIWAENGMVFEGSFDDFEQTLLRQHSLIEGEVSDLYSDRPEVVQGRLVYNRCSQFQPSLDGREVPGHFAHGTFNALADEGLLGWHPRFDELLKGESS